MTSRRVLGIGLAALALAYSSVSGRNPAVAQREEPELRLNLEGGTDWINTAGPIHAADLKGKIVLLDFWTFCCINCHHVLPDLAYLEEKYKNELVVIGVHSPKFPAEAETANIRKKVAEYRIKHPVINDGRRAMWEAYGVRSWPSLYLFDATGKFMGRAEGEGNREMVDEAIGHLVKEAKAAKTLDTRPFVVRPESEKPHVGGLKFPGKVFADATGKRLFISDTGHNRIVVTDLAGKPIDVIGTGREGKKDGPYDQATFNRPQGLTLVGDILYVADTESHAIRAVDTKEKAVSTVAGTGEQAPGRPRGGPAKTSALSSPWDVLLIPGTRTLAIAMAGTHQIWKLDLDDNQVFPWAGNGRENIVDGTLVTAEFAQPSGLATDGDHLFVADSETSSLRMIGLKGDQKGKVTRIVGHGLFEFADVDGRGPEVRLQHDLGVAYGDGRLFVADSYNNKIKVCEPATKSVQTLAGNRESGRSDDPPQFDEPGGLSVAGTKLYVADTNNHAIRVLDLKTGKARTLALAGLAAPPEPKAAPSFPRATLISVPPAQVKPGEEVAIDVKLSIPAGYKLNAEAPLLYVIEASDPSALGEGVSPTGTKVDPPVATFTIKVPLAKAAQDGDELRLKLSLAEFVCKSGSSGFCTVNNFVWELPLRFAADGEAKVSVTNVPAK